MLRPGMRTSSIFNTQHVATRRNRMAKRTQHVAFKCCDRLAGASESFLLAGGVWEQGILVPLETRDLIGKILRLFIFAPLSHSYTTYTASLVSVLWTE